jgi:hypothetical protein
MCPKIHVSSWLTTALWWPSSCGGGHFVRARHARRTPASELPGTETARAANSSDELSWTVYRRERSFRGATSQFRSENEQRVEDRCYGECDKRRGDRQLATHGTIMCLALRLPRLPALVETRPGFLQLQLRSRTLDRLECEQTQANVRLT